MMKSMNTLKLLILLCSALAMQSCSSITVNDIAVKKQWQEGESDERRSFKALEGNGAPRINFSNWINSSGTSLAELQGRVVVLHFLGAQFDASLEIAAQINQLQKKFADEVVFIGACHPDFAVDLNSKIKKNRPRTI